MPTVIHFIGGQESRTVEEDYEKVSTTFHAADVGQFTLAGSGRLVTIYRSAVAYIEEPPPDPMLAYVE
jgi:hypothetical protein